MNDDRYRGALPASVDPQSEDDGGSGGSPVSVAVILVAFESAHVIGEALASIEGANEIICVDNASTDDLQKLLEGRGVKHIRNDRNVGFGRACNQAAEAASSELLLFMNPDVVLKPGAVATLVEAASRYGDADVFAPRTLLPSGALWFHDISTLEYASFSRRYWRDSIAGDCCTRFVDGGVFLIRRKTFMEVGGFDERFFLYFEDDDLTHRLLAKGKAIIHVDGAIAVHKIGQSSKKGLKPLLVRAYHKKISEHYIKRKYGIAVKIGQEYRETIAKLLYYIAMIRVRRAAQSLGRLLALSHAKDQKNQ
jgi:N-acetylglucosaminyl-diphospho-decaprenol L-rhamnosyltransferase